MKYILMTSCHKHKTLGSYHHIMDVMCVPQIHIWKPYPQCDGLGGGVFGRSFGFGEVMRVELSGMGLVPSWGSPDSLLPLLLSSMSGYKEKLAGCNPEEGSHQNSTMLPPDPKLPAPRTVTNTFLPFISTCQWKAVRFSILIVKIFL